MRKEDPKTRPGCAAQRWLWQLNICDADSFQLIWSSRFKSGTGCVWESVAGRFAQTRVSKLSSVSNMAKVTQRCHATAGFSRLKPPCLVELIAMPPAAKRRVRGKRSDAGFPKVDRKTPEESKKGGKRGAAEAKRDPKEAAAAQDLCQLLGWSGKSLQRALKLLKGLSPSQRERRGHRAWMQMIKREKPKASNQLNEGALCVSPRPSKRPKRRKPRHQEFLPEVLCLKISNFLSCVDLASFRRVSRFSHEVVQDSLWQRCRMFACPCPETVLGGRRLSARGRPLKRSGDNKPQCLSIRFLQQPNLAHFFEELDFGEMLGEDLHSLVPAMSLMRHLKAVQLPARGWSDGKSRNQLLKFFEERGISVRS